VSYDYIAYFAQQRPNDLVLVDGAREVRYAEFLRDLKKFIHAAAELGLKRGNSVAIGCDDFYSHWLLILAFEHLGITSTSFGTQEGPSCLPLLAVVDLVLAEPHYPPGGWKTKPLTAQWLQAVFDRPEQAVPPPVRWQPEESVRISRTSGTTGEAKRLHQTRAMIDQRAHQFLWVYGHRPPGTGALITLKLSIAATYRTLSHTLLGGRTVVVGNNIALSELPALIHRHRLSSINLLPVQIKQLLELLPADWVKPERLEITSFGAPVPDELRAAATARLADRILDFYGSNEMGIISLIAAPGSAGFGDILPGVDVEIVDDEDRLLPDGETGLIRTRGVGRFGGYVDDQSLTKRMLRDGWFYPGDLGIRDGRRLQVVGRTGDQVNLGGVKFGLGKIETAAQRSGGAGLKDVGAVAIPNAAGLNEIHVALVTDGSDDRGVVERVSALLGSTITGGVHLIRLPQIPRNDMGKIDRAKLKEAVLAIRAAAAAR
jgi:acyl-coenzyme A synthetase/AMP-(fatty) acid ligase